MINEPKHNAKFECSFFLSFNPFSHHQIVFAKFNLKICYPPPYSRQVWHFKEAENDLIRGALNDFNWERAFSYKNINEKVCIFSKSVLIALSNFIPHETISCDNKDSRCFNSRTKSLLQAKNELFKNCRKKKTNIQLVNKVNFLQE